MKTRNRIPLLALGLLSTLNLQLSTAFAQGTAFTYQGRLHDGGNPATGNYDLRFAICDAPAGGTAVAGPITNSPVGVTNGLFTAGLDFGAGVFTGDALWLEIAVRTNGSTGPFTTLAPRQALTPTPYALFAPNAGVANSAAPGSIGTAALAAGAVDSSRITDGTIAASDLGPGVLSNTFWRRDGNAGTSAGTHFLGTTDNQPLEMKVGGARALRLEPNSSGAPNVIGGASRNLAGPGVVGATIAGGGATDFAGFAYTNAVRAPYGSIGGGFGNSIADNASAATIAGGRDNTIRASSYSSAVGGGSGNHIGTNSEYATIAGGGFSEIGALSPHAAIGGGNNNYVLARSGYATVAGGQANFINTNSAHSVISGGGANNVGANSSAATIGGGYNNTLATNAEFATIPGGRLNRATNYAFAAGNRAKANHTGAFVWADSTDADFVSTSNKQFLIRAAGGVGINTNNPQGALHVAGAVTADSFAGSGAGLTALDGAALTDGSVTSAKIASGAVTTSQLAHGAVGSNQLASGAVTTGALADGAVTAAKVATATNWFALTLANPTPAGGDNFGASVAGVGSDRVLIGAHQDDTGALNAGAAYLFRTNGTLLTTLTKPTPAAGDGFGISVAGVGSDRVLIGAFSDDTDVADAGAAYLFRTDGTLLRTFPNPTPAVGDGFGWSVAAVGSDQVLIGAHQDDAGAFNAGAAYLFSTNGWLLTTFPNPTPAVGDGFGWSVAAVGSDRVLIGAYQDDAGAFNAGAAYLFSTDGMLLTTFTNPAPAAGDEFGYSVAAVGSDRVLIGAHRDDTGATYAGAAYLFSTNGTLLTTFTKPTPVAFDYFGTSVAAVGGDRVLIGAYQDDTGAGNAGAAYLFRTDGTLLTAFTKPTPAADDNFGISVAAVGSDRVLLGANLDDTGADGAGAACLFSLETYTPGLIAEEVAARSVTTASLEDGAVTLAKFDPTIGVWTRADDNIYRLAGNVGIGTHTPVSALHVNGTVTATSFAGSGAGLTGLNASQLTSGTVPDARLGVNVARTNQVWLLGGNAGTTPGTHFLGTGDNQPLELKVNNRRGWRLEPTADGAGRSNMVNVVAGSPVNVVGAGVYGATISGGGALHYLGNPSINRVDGDVGTIGGGLGNTIQGGYSTIGGGARNTIQTGAASSTIGGGAQNTNLPNANFATIPGGFQNTATNAAFAAGYRAKAVHTGAFVWGDSTAADIASTTSNSVTMRASGGYRLFSNSGATAGVSLAPGGTSWAVISDRNAKKDFAPVDGVQVLEKLAVLPITQWHYHWETENTTPHIGPMAQDFKAAFYPGTDDKVITTQEADGVALAAIQGLNEKVEGRSQKLERQLQQKETEITELRQALTELKVLVQTLAEKVNGGGQ